MSSEKNFDYVIAGGGSAGCALAARLAEDPAISVALVEAGGHGRNLFVRMPAGNGFVFGNPDLDWAFESVPQPGLNQRQIYYPRGKALGGTSIMNGMIYMRGVPEDYDAWRDAGMQGWGFADLLPYFRRSEGSRDRRDDWHGTDGPLKTEPSVNFGVLEEAFISAAKAAGHRELEDFNGPERTGVSRTDSTVSRGIRQSSAIAYLSQAPANLTRLTRCHISTLLFQGDRATGLKTTDGDTILADREVILCLGAFATPQVLMLSGIGPADHLSEHGIKTRVDLPGVGTHLEDHIDVSMQYGSDHMDLSLARFQRLDKAALLMGRWLLNHSGPGAGAFFSAVLFHAIRNRSLPELEVFMTPMIVDENLTSGDDEKTPLLQRLGRKLLVRGRKVARPGVQIDINLERPKSSGTVRLASTNPLDHPVIDPQFLSRSEDMDDLVAGVEVMREVMSQPQIARYVSGELGAWENAKTRAEIEQAIRTTAYTGHHPACTARMGGSSDDHAVLDDQLRVRDVQGLRVCDASAMPTQITGNLNATVIAMAEKAADLILGRQAPAPQDPR